MENLQNQQMEDKLGLVIEKGKVVNPDKPDKIMFSDAAANIRSSLKSISRDKLNNASETKYIAVLEALEKSIPVYNVSL